MDPRILILDDCTRTKECTFLFIWGVSVETQLLLFLSRFYTLPRKRGVRRPRVLRAGRVRVPSSWVRARDSAWVPATGIGRRSPSKESPDCPEPRQGSQGVVLGHEGSLPAQRSRRYEPVSGIRVHVQGIRAQRQLRRE
jgi:hypothetical protein